MPQFQSHLTTPQNNEDLDLEVDALNNSATRYTQTASYQRSKDRLDFLFTSEYFNRDQSKIIRDYLLQPLSMFLARWGFISRKSQHWLSTFLLLAFTWLVAAISNSFHFSNFVELGGWSKFGQIAFGLIAPSLVTNALTHLYLWCLSLGARNVGLLTDTWRMRADVNKHLSRIIGHKVWAGAQTHDFLKTLIDNETAKRTKWQVVNFMSTIANNQITKMEGGGGVVVWKATTESHGAWDLVDYSRFLQNNIEYAEEEILWLVDPDDFQDYLFPMAIRFVLSAKSLGTLSPLDLGHYNSVNPFSAELLYTKPPQEFAQFLRQSAINPNNNISAENERSQLLKRASNPDLDLLYLHAPEEYRKCLRSLPEVSVTTLGRGHISFGGPPAKAWRVRTEVVLQSMALYGAKLLNNDKKLLVWDDLNGNYNTLYDTWIIDMLPHINSFKRRCRLPQKYRRILLRHDCGSDRDTKVTAKRIAEHLKQVLGTELQVNEEKWHSVVKCAFDCFSDLSGGSDRIQVHYFNRGRQEYTKEEYDALAPLLRNLDVGMYDKRFILHAKTVDPSGSVPYRVVSWYYRPDKDMSIPGMEFYIELLKGDHTSPIDDGYEVLKTNVLKELENGV